jgi:(1->4)-alpha-D-glucan 1-alpha-D-glucosylmutase
MSPNKGGRAPVSTYRVQLHGKFAFEDVARLSPYFKELGISGLYLSPIFTSVPGSQHGYDVTNYSEVNPELGGLDGFRALAASLKSHGSTILLDFVPNHMGIAGMLNQWWRDVMEYGLRSKYASYFDIQWKSDDGEDHPRVLVPLLSDHYGRVLEKGDIKLVYENEFSIRYGDTTLPVRPESYGTILKSIDSETATSGDLRDIAEGFLSARTPATKLKVDLGSLVERDPKLKERITAALKALNGNIGDPASFDRLHNIIENQHYRLARWQAGTHEINYRRFFAIDTLVGLHMENPEVFRECHALLGRLLASGDVTGLRIDHIDGLRQPEDYLVRIQSLERVDHSQFLYVLVEKILARGERLPRTWPVHGTTGYEFIAQLGDILIDHAEEGRIDEIYARFTGERMTYADLVCRSKRLIIAEMFANAISNLGAELVQLVSADRLWRDLTRHELTTAVSELVTHLSVYRTYRRRQEAVAESDRLVLEKACAEAIAANPRADPQPIEFLRDLLVGQYPPANAPEEYRNRVLSWVLTFQQYTGAIMAKSVEDTVFYNYNRFIALNEVGCDPGIFGGSIDGFHRTNATRLSDSPMALLTTSTHDSKLSEDVRARLYALSELGTEWEACLNRWRVETLGFTTTIDGRTAPDALDQYRFFQSLVGAWPLADDEVDTHFRERLKEHFRKAVNEAKRHTSILNSNDAYLAACDRFVDGITIDDKAGTFRSSFVPFAHRVARLGMVNSLTQLVLKCTVPGVPDFYQGNELWDFSLVDPDNRRPVDFDGRIALMRDVSDAPLSGLLEDWRDGGIKLKLTRELLRLRAAFPRLFSHGSYTPVEVRGAFNDRVISFRRALEGESLLVAVPRIIAKIGCPPLGPVWDDTRLESVSSKLGWQDAFTGRIFEAGKSISVKTLFAELPFAVLQNRREPNPK